jgi:hypothetical protein
MVLEPSLLFLESFGLGIEGGGGVEYGFVVDFGNSFYVFDCRFP